MQKFNSMRCTENIQAGIFFDIYKVKQHEN